MKKYIAILMMLVIAVSLFGCSAAPEEQTTEAPAATEATEAPTAAAEVTEAIDTEEKLNMALAVDLRAELDASLNLEKTVVMYEGVLDGKGNTLFGPVYVEGQVDTQNGIAMQSGTLKDITIVDAYRCIGDTKENPQSGNIYLENVTVDGPTYALNFGYGNFTEHLIVDDSKLLGWSSYTGFATATFTNCTFGWDSTGENGNLRPYVDTILTNCTFEGKTADDGSIVPFNISLRESISGITITLEDCYVGDILITEENISELLNVELFDNELYVSNTEE